jgi:hypothetical protein
MKAKCIVAGLLFALTSIALCGSVEETEARNKAQEQANREKIQKENKEQREAFNRQPVIDWAVREHNAVVRHIRALEAAQIKDRAKAKQKVFAPAKNK